jgi:hypothetical protein
LRSGLSGTTTISLNGFVSIIRLARLGQARRYVGVTLPALGSTEAPTRIRGASSRDVREVFSMSRDEIISQNPIADFVRNRGHELKRAGDNFVTGGCPVTQHKSGHSASNDLPKNTVVVVP